MASFFISFIKIDRIASMPCFIPHLEGHQTAFQTRYRTLKSVARNPSYNKMYLFLAHPVYWLLFVDNEYHTKLLSTLCQYFHLFRYDFSTILSSVALSNFGRISWYL